VTGEATDRAPTVFVGSDHVLDDILSGVAERLATAGLRVVRGPAAPPPHRTRYRPDEWPQYFADASVAVISSRTEIPPELMDWAQHLRGVVFASSSTASCDLPAATRAGIAVAAGATPENMESMAEATVMLAVALMLDLPVKQRQLADARPRPAPADITARMLAGSTVGLIGFGRIAREVVARLAGWKPGQILACVRHPERYGDWPGVSFVDLDRLLAESDVVSLHVPLDAATVGLLGRRELARMKPGAVLVNTSRGGLVDENALVDALRSGRLRGAAIDTFVHEPVPVDHPLRQCENVILTEHIVGHTRELFDSLVPAAVANVTAILAGRRPLHLANREVLPYWRGAAVVVQPPYDGAVTSVRPFVDGPGGPERR
jgi:D-3-phosphoglycerate dehydrogenase